VEYYLSNISRNKHLNAFTAVFADEALQKAAALDKKRKSWRTTEEITWCCYCHQRCDLL
jgi:Asp-tRNA(Asn)/Glu-tRNA(Gln) amidotransferase A subunit family amidase